jgi:hypothetical protein
VQLVEQWCVRSAVKNAFDVGLHHPAVASSLLQADALCRHAHTSALTVGVAAVLEFDL